jgi:hypothetical protein
VALAYAEGKIKLDRPRKMAGVDERSEPRQAGKGRAPMTEHHFNPTAIKAKLEWFYQQGKPHKAREILLQRGRVCRAT